MSYFQHLDCGTFGRAMAPGRPIIIHVSIRLLAITGLLMGCHAGLRNWVGRSRRLDFERCVFWRIFADWSLLGWLAVICACSTRMGRFWVARSMLFSLGMMLDRSMLGSLAAKSSLLRNFRILGIIF